MSDERREAGEPTAGFDDKIKALLADVHVGPALREYLSGFVQANRARRTLLDQTIAHVEALDLLERLDALASAKSVPCVPAKASPIPALSSSPLAPTQEGA